MNRLFGLQQFYEMLDAHAERHGGRMLLAELNKKLIPRRGVYFFFDENELRQDSGNGAKIVRIGTHALKAGSISTLPQRLGQHLGPKKGGGNHRGSIFRNLVGQAILARDRDRLCPSWGIARDLTKASAALGTDRRSLVSSEQPVENNVSDYLARLTFTFLNIDDEPGANSRRGFVERNAIALLSNHDRPALDAPSASWLGNMSNRELVRRSGLWNQRHVTESCDEAFLEYIAAMIGQQSHECV
jgi:hypothetical protein